MENDSQTAVEKIFKGVLENPLWHLCRSNTENAHSNFWAYLIKKTGNLNIILGKDVPVDVKSVYREKKHFDLLIETKAENEVYIIENKFKSIADAEQLVKYRDSYLKDLGKKKKRKMQTIHLVLVTPFKWQFSAQEENIIKDLKDLGLKVELEYLTYLAIAKNIKSQQANDNTTNTSIIAAYIKLLEEIDATIGAFVVDERNRSLCSFWGETDKSFAQEMRNEKLHAICVKNIAEIIKNDVEQECSLAKHGIICETNYFSGNAVLKLRYVYSSDSNKDFGVEFQAGTMRRFCTVYATEAINNIVAKHSKKGDIIPWNDLICEIKPFEPWLGDRAPKDQINRFCEPDKKCIFLYTKSPAPQNQDDFMKAVKNECNQMMAFSKKLKSE